MRVSQAKQEHFALKCQARLHTPSIIFQHFRPNSARSAWYELFVTNLLLFDSLSTNKKLLISQQFSGPYGITKYGSLSGWRKDVVNQCLKFGMITDAVTN